MIYSSLWIMILGASSSQKMKDCEVKWCVWRRKRNEKISRIALSLSQTSFWKQKFYGNQIYLKWFLRSFENKLEIWQKHGSIRGFKTAAKDKNQSSKFTTKASKDFLLNFFEMSYQNIVVNWFFTQLNTKRRKKIEFKLYENVSLLSWTQFWAQCST